MKPKGVSFIELHCEKFFLAIMTLAALAVLALQFTGEGNVVDIGPDRGVRLDQAYAQIAAEAESKLGQLEQTRPSAQAPPAETDYAERFASAVSGGLPSLAEAPLSAPHPEIGGPIRNGDRELVVEAVDVGSPARPETGVFLGSVEPTSGLRDAYEEILGDGAWPRDIRAITVETVFDAEALRSRLTEDPDGTGPAQAAPVGFWRSRHLIAAVVFERQRLRDDGSWSDSTTLPPAPGALNTAELVAEAQAGVQVADLIGLIKGDRGWEIVRPAFVNTVSPSSWWPPSFERALAQGGDAEALTSELERLTAQGASLRNIDRMPLWTHDYAVEAGEIYRYRARVWIPNPYFGFGPALAEESKPLAEAPFLEGDRSAWSDPVTAPRSMYWYAFSGSDGAEGPLAGRASARIDLFGFMGGRWRHTQERFEPGDPIRATVEFEDGQTRLLETGARLLDVAPASLNEPDARGRQNPIQLVAATPDGLDLREVWRDRGSAKRRELLAEADAGPQPAEVEQPQTPEPRQEPTRDRRVEDRRGVDRQ